MNSTVKKRSIVIGRRKTSISLEDIFWTNLQQIARRRLVTISDLIGSLDAARENSNLSSAIRVFILDQYRTMAVENRRRAVIECEKAAELSNERPPSNGEGNDPKISDELSVSEI